MKNDKMLFSNIDSGNVYFAPMICGTLRRILSLRGPVLGVLRYEHSVGAMTFSDMDSSEAESSLLLLMSRARV